MASGAHQDQARTFVCFSLLALCCSLVSADIYMQNPRGSNNRLTEASNTHTQRPIQNLPQGSRNFFPDYQYSIFQNYQSFSTPNLPERLFYLPFRFFKRVNGPTGIECSTRRTMNVVVTTSVRCTTTRAAN